MSFLFLYICTQYHNQELFFLCSQHQIFIQLWLCHSLVRSVLYSAFEISTFKQRHTNIQTIERSNKIFSHYPGSLSEASSFIASFSSFSTPSSSSLNFNSTLF